MLLIGTSEGDDTADPDKLDPAEFAVVLMAPLGEDEPTLVFVRNGQAV